MAQIRPTDGTGGACRNVRDLLDCISDFPPLSIHPPNRFLIMNAEQKIIPHLWFDDQAEEAVEFYSSHFDGSSQGRITHYPGEGQEIHGQPEGAVMTVEFKLAGYSMLALNAGPHFHFNPAISFFVVCESEQEIDTLWSALSDGGQALMPLDRYDWSEKYGWVQDRFGLTWQLALGDLSEVAQKITPSFLFVGEQRQAEEAVKFYTSVFDNSDIVGILRYGPGEHLPHGQARAVHAERRGLHGDRRRQLAPVLLQ